LIYKPVTDIPEDQTIAGKRDNKPGSLVPDAQAAAPKLSNIEKVILQDELKKNPNGPRAAKIKALLGGP
jgi:hypothetical protein